MPGLVALVSHYDGVHVGTLGARTFGGAPMTRDTIFRIASITKPLTAAATMILVEDCKLRLDDPVERWLPELANRRVLKSIASDLDDTTSAARAITVRDLLTSRMGFGSVMAKPDALSDSEADPRIPHRRRRPADTRGGAGYGRVAPQIGLAAIGWRNQAETVDVYALSSDALGAPVARVSGKSLGEFMRERIFEPLGMKDTGFPPSPPEKLGRLPGFYYFNREKNALDDFDGIADTPHGEHETSFQSGGGGLLSTIDDYFAFCRMMRNKGWLGRERILSRAAVELMTSDQLTPEAPCAGADFPGRPFEAGASGWACASHASRSTRRPAATGGTAASALRRISTLPRE